MLLDNSLADFASCPDSSCIDSTTTCAVVACTTPQLEGEVACLAEALSIKYEELSVICDFCQHDEMALMFEGTIESLVSALDAKDAYTCGHSSRVAELAVRLARRLEYDEASLQRIRMAGTLHDIGKIGIEDAVLRKPEKLTDAEFEQIKLHPLIGYDILKGIRPFRRILPAVRHHHESWDGSGYPDGLRGETIPRDAQVLAVADAFDAMASSRPYREGMPIERVFKIFIDRRNIQWAGDVVDELLKCY